MMSAFATSSPTALRPGTHRAGLRRTAVNLATAGSAQRSEAQFIGSGQRSGAQFIEAQFIVTAKGKKAPLLVEADSPLTGLADLTYRRHSLCCLSGAGTGG